MIHWRQTPWLTVEGFSESGFSLPLQLGSPLLLPDSHTTTQADYPEFCSLAGTSAPLSGLELGLCKPVCAVRSSANVTSSL